MTVITGTGGQAVGAIGPLVPTVVLSMGPPGKRPVGRTLLGGRPVLPPVGPPPESRIDVALGKFGGTPANVGLPEPGPVPEAPAVLS